jgi:hypothetical protein
MESTLAVDSVEAMVVGWAAEWAAHLDRAKDETMAGGSAGH